MGTKAIAISVFLLFTSSCQLSRLAGSNPSKHKDIGYKLFQSIDGSYGYDIIQNGKVIIHQPFIPVVPGNIGFHTKRQAKSIAKLVEAKIAQGIFPPSLSREEVESIVGEQKN